MDLAKHQQALLSLITRGTDCGETDDPYIRSVAHCPQLELLREVVLWLREFDIDRTCVLTSGLLKRRGLFKQTVREFAARGLITPYPSELAEAFLEDTARHPDHMVASTAQFELAVIKVKRGDTREYSVDWPCDPRPILTGEAAGDTGR